MNAHHSDKTHPKLPAAADASEGRKTVHAAATPPSVTRLTKARRFIVCSYFGGLSIGAVKHQRSPSAESTAVLLYCVALDSGEGLLCGNALGDLAVEADHQIANGLSSAPGNVPTTAGTPAAMNARAMLNVPSPRCEGVVSTSSRTTNWVRVIGREAISLPLTGQNDESTRRLLPPVATAGTCCGNHARHDMDDRIRRCIGKQPGPVAASPTSNDADR